MLGDTVVNRLVDLQHNLWKITLGGSLHLAPIGAIPKVLDLGTGTGIWAIDFGMNCTLLKDELLMLQMKGTQIRRLRSLEPI